MYVCEFDIVEAHCHVVDSQGGGGGGINEQIHVTDNNS